MEEFISNCITHICKNHTNLSNIKIILPHKTTIIYFKEKLKKKVINNFLPDCITISNFIQQYSNLSLIQGIPLWIITYSIFLKKNPEEKFNYFLKWIPTVLNDFNDILSYHKHPKKIINFMSSSTRIKSWNLKSNTSKNIKKELCFWEKIAIFYNDLNIELLQKKIGFKAMLEHNAYNNIIKHNNIRDFYYFIGFNTLTKIESDIIKYLIKNKQAEIIINGDKYYLKNNTQEPGKFLREILLWKEINIQKLNFIYSNFTKKKTIKQYPVYNSIMNAKIIANILNKIPTKEYNNTAIVLCDNKLLLPTLQSIPTKIKNLNIRLGLSYSHLSINLFFFKFFQIQNIIRKNKKLLSFFDLKELLNFNFFPKKLKISYEIFIKKLINNNTSFVHNKILINYFKEFPISRLFHKYNKPKLFIKQLIKLTDYIIKNNINTDIINNTIFTKNHELLNQFYEIIEQINFIYDFESLQLLFKEFIKNEKINFKKQLNSLHIIEVMPTSILNFNNLIIVSTNENNNNQQSLIPLIIKEKFKINNYINNQNIFTSCLYQLIQNSNNIHLIYDLSINKEKHHFIKQLEIESVHKIETIKYKFLYKPNFKEKIKITKTLYIQQKIINWLNNKLSPTSIGLYLYNQINFYKKYILNIKESKNIEKEMSNKTIGNLIHVVLFHCYKKFINKKLTIKNCEYIEKSINIHLNNTIQKLKIFPSNFGPNYLQIQLIYTLIKKIINFDKKLVHDGNNLKILHLEYSLNTNFIINKKYAPLLQGIIDRIDTLNGITRIIDYKNQIENKEYILSTSVNNNSYHIIQMIIYLYCYAKENQLYTLQTGIWGFNQINEGVKFLNYIDNNQKNNILKFKKIEKLISLKLKKIIKEIINFKKPFIEKPKYRN